MVDNLLLSNGVSFLFLSSPIPSLPVYQAHERPPPSSVLELAVQPTDDLQHQKGVGIRLGASSRGYVLPFTFIRVA
jgi:hypothetical protein